MDRVRYLLEDFNEENWKRFYTCLPQYRCPTGTIPDDLWSAMKYQVSSVDNYILKWIEQKVPALGNLTPAKVLQLPEGGNILRALLMRMPC